MTNNFAFSRESHEIKMHCQELLSLVIMALQPTPEEKDRLSDLFADIAVRQILASDGVIPVDAQGNEQQGGAR